MMPPDQDTLITCVKKEFSEKSKDFFDTAELRVLNMALENISFTGVDSAKLYLKVVEKVKFLMEKNEGIGDPKGMPNSTKKD